MKLIFWFRKNWLSRVVGLHLLCWSIFITYELLYVLYVSKKLEPAYVYVCYYGLNLLCFYSNVKLLSYVFSRSKTRYLRGLACLLLLIMIYLSLKFLISYLLSVPKPDFAGYPKKFVALLPFTFFRIFYFLVLSTFYWAAGHISLFRKQAAAAERQELLMLKEKAELETGLAHARNAYLTQQVNPHLLFNSLNFIYDSVSRFSREASNSVMLLSELLQFSLQETGPDGKIKLSDEIDQLHRLFAINRYRFEGQQEIEFESEGNFELYRIIPLILFTLTENIFKHGKLRNAQARATLLLKVNETGRLQYFSRNLKKSKSGYPSRRQIGLDNVRIRLDFAYPGLYTLDISETGEYFELSLNLQL